MIDRASDAVAEGSRSVVGAAPSYAEPALLIDGEWVTDGARRTLSIRNPADGTELGQLPVATDADVDRAAAAAARAFPSWRATPARERGLILARVAALVREHADELAMALTLEQGKTLLESAGEIAATADTFEWFAEEAKRMYGRVVPSRLTNVRQFVLHEPIGPVAAFSPWNFPVVLAARKIAPALAAGCTIVIKPAEETPGGVFALARLCVLAGVPAGALNVLYGEPAAISARLIASPHIRMVTFTGSVGVGKHLAALAGAAMKRATMELGGHSPVIVCDDVDVERVAELAIASKFRNAGQICHAPTRFFVHERVYDAFAEAFGRRAGALRIGNGLEKTTQMGPLANERRLAAMKALTDDAVSSGALVVTGGQRSGASGFFWQPTVLSDVPPAARVMREEPFGPIAPLARFRELDEALALANAVEYGLAAYAFTNSITKARRIIDGIEAGALSLNTFAMSPPEMPFGGVKSSGQGREMGSEGLLEYATAKSVIQADAP
jgi:succinate-semialdehyde dehydrogenase/glutarate-semialdehyde dehydrogenase